MRTNSLLGIGLVGTVIAALCCFTPILVVMVGAVGLSAITGYLDYVLFPVFGLFVLLTIYALWRRQKHLSTQMKEDQDV